MANSYIHERMLKSGKTRFDVIIEFDPDPLTNRRARIKRTFASRKEAKAQAARLLAEADSGSLVAANPTTIAQLMEIWLTTVAIIRVSPRTLDHYRDTIKAHIVPFLGHFMVQKLTTAAVQAFYAQRLVDGVGARTLQLVHLHLSQALRYAEKMSWVGKNIMTLVDRPRWQSREMTYWTQEEARAFLAVTGQSFYAGPLWELALSTGLRRGELLGVRWMDLSADCTTLQVTQTLGACRNGTVEIKVPKTRTSRRTVHIPDTVAVKLRRHRAERQTVTPSAIDFPRKSRPSDAQAASPVNPVLATLRPLPP